MLSSEQQAEIEQLLVQAGLAPDLSDEQLYMDLGEKLLGVLRTMVDTTLAHMSTRDRFVAALIVAEMIAESLKKVLKDELQG